MEIISLKQVEIDSGHDVLLEKTDFSLGDDTRVGLVGANGSGKSTLLRAIVGLAEVSQGRIIVTKGSRVEYVPQAIPSELIDTPLLQALLDKIETTRPDIEEWRAYDILTRFGLGDHFERPLGSLSGGEGNRAMLARAVVVEPDFLLLDEPTNHISIVFGFFACVYPC